MLLALISILMFAFAIFLLITQYQQEAGTEPYVNIPPLTRKPTYDRDFCLRQISKTLLAVLQEHNIPMTDMPDAGILRLPCSYNDTHQEVADIEPRHRDERIFILSNGDEIAHKNMLWSNLVKTWGRQQASKLAPLTYDLAHTPDRELLRREFNPGKVYILKKNIQRQKGLLLTQDLDQIMEAYNDGYVIAQEVLQDPYLINGRKINLRVYLLIAAQHGDITAWVYDNGFMYYTKALFKRGTTEEEPTITTGYIDRKVYEENPLTHEDFRQYLDSPNRRLTPAEARLRSQGIRLSHYVFHNIYALLRQVVIAIRRNICNGQKLMPYLTFQLFGVDIAVDDQLGAKIIEVNKGPDMEAKDGRDGDLKKGVYADMFRVMKIIPSTERNHFIKIYE